MKNKISIMYIVLAAMLTAAIGCSKMDAMHEEYLDGENIYAGKLDSLVAYSGYKRVKIVGLTRYLGNSNSCTVQWEDRSEEFSIADANSENFEFIVDALDERNYEFTIYTTDVEGNKSILQTCKGRAIGDNFKESQSPRRVTGFDFKDEGTFINWAAREESEFVIFTDLMYETNEGMDTVRVLPEDSKILLANWKPLGKLEMISAVKSGDFGFDTIYLDKVESKLPPPPYSELDKQFFSLVRMPSDNKGDSYGANPVAYLFDGDGSWKNSDQFGYHSGENSIPHHFTIDLGVKAKIRKCKLDLRDPNNYSGNNPTKVELWGINDISNAETASSDPTEFESKGWTLLFRGDIEGEFNQSVSFDVDPADAVRYVRYRVVSSVGNSGAQLTEMTFWGQDVEPVELDKANISLVRMESDNKGDSYGADPVTYLFDGDSSWRGSDQYGFHSGENSIPHHFTIDLGCVTTLGKCELGLRDPGNYNGNNPTEVEIWGIADISEAETTSEDADEFKAKGWQLLSKTIVDGANNQKVSFDIEKGPEVRYIRYKVLSSVGGSGAQLTEMTFWGFGPKPISNPE